MRCHEILITFMRATQVPQSGIEFASHHSERIYPFRGNREILDAFFGKRKMHLYVRQKFARWRMFFSQKSECTEVYE